MMLQAADLANSFDTVQTYYDAGRYLDAYQASIPLGPLQNWTSPEGRVIAGRLANNLGAPRLAAALHWLGSRAFPDNWECTYFSALNYLQRFGAVHAWRKYRNVSPPCSAARSVRAEWLAFKATILASLRDFARANELVEDAFSLDSENPWIRVEKAWVLDSQDCREEALQVARSALALRPTFRPAIQFVGQCLTQMRRDDEAIELLGDSASKLQSGDIWCQLAVLQHELNMFDAAWESLAQAEKYWPLAASDSQHRQWLANYRSNVAYARGDLPEALRLVSTTKGPYVESYVQRLRKAIEAPSALPHRIQLKVPFIRQEHRTCAPASLASIAQYWDRDIKHEEIIQQICYQGTEASDERFWAESNQFYVREFRATQAAIGSLIRAQVPLALCTVEPTSAHMQVIVGIDDVRETFLIQDPSQRHLREMPVEASLEHYASSGPRVLLLIPVNQQQRIEGIELPDAEFYDDLYRIKRALKYHKRDEADLVSVAMQSRDPSHRLTLEAKLALAQYDANQALALEACQQMLEAFPDNVNLRLYQLSLLGELGRREQRLEILRSACRATLASSVLATRLVSELVDDARDYREAAQRLRRPLRFSQIDGRAIWLQGYLLWNQGERADALEFYRLAASVDETDEWHARSYFVASRYLHQSSQVLAWLEDRNRQFGERSSAPGQTLAWAYMQIDQIQRAFDLFDSTIDLHPEDGNLRCSVALQLGNFNRHTQAAEHLNAARNCVKQATFERTAAKLAKLQGRIGDARSLLKRPSAGAVRYGNVRGDTAT